MEKSIGNPIEEQRQWILPAVIMEAVPGVQETGFTRLRSKNYYMPMWCKRLSRNGDASSNSAVGKHKFEFAKNMQISLLNRKFLLF